MLGSTGSIGVNTLDVIAHARKVYGDARLSADGADRAAAMSKLLIEQARAFKPQRAVIGDDDAVSAN